MADVAVSPMEDPHDVEYWHKRWVEDRIGWHKSQVNPHLLKHIELVTGQKLTGEPLSDPAQFQQNSTNTWFVPLCGKTLDIPYLLSQGFRVFGVEGVRMAVETLNSEQSLDMTFNEETKLFTGASGRLRIYLGNLFTCPLETFGPFDYVWDRGSFIALEYPFRKEYSETMQRALRKKDGSWYNFSYLLETVQYDKSKFEGPPRSVSDEDIKEYFESWANVRWLTTDPIPEGSSVYKALGGEGGETRVFHVTPKV